MKTEIMMEDDNYAILEPKEEESDLKCLEKNLTNIIHQKKFCGLCFEADTHTELWMTNMEFEVTTFDDPVNKTLLEILHDVFHKATLIPASDYVCKDCTEKTIQSYIFIHSTIEAAKTVDSYVNSFYSKVYSLDEQLEPNADYSELKFVVILEPDEVFPTNNTKVTNLYKNSHKGEKKAILELETDDSSKRKVAEIKVQTVETQAKKENYFVIEPIKRKMDVDSSDGEDRETVRVIQKKTISKKSDSIRVTEKKIIKKSNVVGTQMTNQNRLGYRCLRCNLEMSSFHLWKAHKATCNKNVNEECTVCQQKFTSKKLLITHYKTHQIAQCRFCDELLSETELNGHLRQKHDHETYSCDKCESVFYNSMSWKAHMKLEHSIVAPSSDGSTLCLMCLKFIQEDQMPNHLCRYKCPDCEEMPCRHHKYLIHYKKQLLTHLKDIKCLDCDYICRQKSNLIGHVNKEHLNYQPYKCNICLSQYYSKHSFNTHMSNHKKDTFVCKYCDEPIKEEEEYLEHMKVCSQIKRQFECSLCEASFTLIEKLSSHINTKHTTKYTCEICQKQYASESRYNDHIIKGHKEGIYVCQIKNPNNTEKHTENVTLVNSVQCYKCEQCSKDFYDLREYIKHGCTIISYPCEVCGCLFYCQLNLSKHLKGHIDLPCKVCAKLIDSASMVAHMKTHQKGKPKRSKTYMIRKHKCSYCDHVTFTKGMLEGHVNRYHLKLKPYKCDQCDVSYPSKYQLTEHKVVHDQNKWLKCETCGKVFLRSTSLKRHIMLHTGEKPYTCEICNEGFKSLSMMKEHKIKHLERTVTCPLCKIMFYTIREVRAHIIKVHWKDKEKKFDPKELTELDKKDYYIFKDARKVHMSDDESE